MGHPLAAADVRLFLFGAFRLLRGGALVRLPTRKVESLLAYLALHPLPVPREQLAALLWGEAASASAAASLRTALSALRKALGAAALLTDRATVQLNPAFPVWVDVRAYHAARAPEADPDLYGGDLLADFYDEWLTPLREQYRRQHIARLLAVAQDWRGQSDYPRAIQAAERVLAAEATNETAYQHLIFCHLAAGDQAAAVAQYERCRAVLQRELGVEPLPDTTALYRWIRRVEAPAAAPGAALPSNVPLPISSFVGRGPELAELKRLLAGDVPSAAGLDHPPRLLTLTGPGGSGKTRLAIQLCLSLLAAQTFAGGVWWVPLAPVEHAAHVPQAVAHALGLRPAPARGLVEALIDHLRPRPMLLVLDTCEHVVAACARLAERLLAACPQLKILTTSREWLGLPGEVVQAVPPLAVPQAAHPYTPEALLALDAPRLFMERARAVRPGLTLSAPEAAALAGLCRALEGLPLALELAAAQLRALSLEQLAGRLAQESALEVLAGGHRSAQPRHHTLRATIAWSYGLLSESEQALFRALAVFRGGWTLAAAEQVAGAAAVAPGLARLVDKSLVVADFTGGQPRYRLLDTVRAFAHAALQAQPGAEAVRLRHLACFAALAQAAEAAQYGPGEHAALRQLDDDLSNLRVALQTGLDLPAAAPLALQQASAMLRYWTVRGYAREGCDWLAALLARAAPGPTRPRARALNALGYLAWRQHEVAAARAAFTEALEICEALGPEAPLEHALALRGLGLLAYAERDLGPARRLFAAALPLFRQQGDATGIGYALMGLGEVARAEGRYAEAAEHYAENLALRRAQGSELNSAVALHNSGQVALARGQITQARDYFVEGLQLNHRFGFPQGMALCLAGLAAMEAEGEAPARAVRWLAGAEAWLRALGEVFEPADRPVFDRAVATLRAQLPAAEFHQAWAAGVAAAAAPEQLALEALALYGAAPS